MSVFAVCFAELFVILQANTPANGEVFVLTVFGGFL